MQNPPSCPGGSSFARGKRGPPRALGDQSPRFQASPSKPSAAKVLRAFSSLGSTAGKMAILPLACFARWLLLASRPGPSFQGGSGRTYNVCLFGIRVKL
jgi:hypothetical protein